MDKIIELEQIDKVRGGEYIEAKQPVEEIEREIRYMTKEEIESMKLASFRLALKSRNTPSKVIPYEVLPPRIILRG